MKFKPTDSETIITNIFVKHKLTQQETRIIASWLTDTSEKGDDGQPGYSATPGELEERTGINITNVSKAIRGLIYMGILVKLPKISKIQKYELNKTLFKKSYIPEHESATDFYKTERNGHRVGKGNSRTKKIKLAPEIGKNKSSTQTQIKSTEQTKPQSHQEPPEINIGESTGDPELDEIMKNLR